MPASRYSTSCHQLPRERFSPSAHPCRCRASRGRSLHHPICRPSSSSVANRGLLSSRPTPLASRLRASWMEARVTRAARVSARFSKALGETPVSSEPGEGALDHPTAQQNDEALLVVAPLDDLSTVTEGIAIGGS